MHFLAVTGPGAASCTGFEKKTESTAIAKPSMNSENVHKTCSQVEKEEPRAED